MTIPRRILLALLIGLGLARAGSYLVGALASLPSPLETFHLEAKMVLLADRARAGLDLYPEWRDYPHVADFFAPLYFSLVGLAGRWSGSDLDGLFAIGRWTSFATGLLTSAAVGWVGVRRYGRVAGLAGAVVSLGTAPTFGFSVMVRPDMLAEFLGVAGFFLAVERSGRLRTLGGAVLVAAALTKQTAVIYAAAASLAWIASGAGDRPRRGGGRRPARDRRGGHAGRLAPVRRGPGGRVEDPVGPGPLAAGRGAAAGALAGHRRPAPRRARVLAPPDRAGEGPRPAARRVDAGPDAGLRGDLGQARGRPQLLPRAPGRGRAGGRRDRPGLVGCPGLAGRAGGVRTDPRGRADGRPRADLRG